MNNSDNYLLDIVNDVEGFLAERELFVLYSRNGYPDNQFLTLDEIAKRVGGVTRERIRQIEAKAIKKLNTRSKRTNIILKFALYFEDKYNTFRNIDIDSFESFTEPSYITFSEYGSLCDKDVFHKALAIFLALTDNKSRIKASSRFEFVYNSKGISETDAALTILGLYKNIISKEEVANLDRISKDILLTNYRLINGVYFRNGMIKRDVILSIVDEYFPDGIRVTNSEHYEKFKKAYTEEYKIECNISPREISTAMGNTGDYCLVDRGTYLRFEKAHLIPQELLDDIVTYVLQDGGTLYYSTIFDAFRNELMNEGIDNWFYFKGVFDKQCKGMFFTRRATLSVNSRKQFEDPIYDYITRTAGLITMQELRNKFPGLKDYMFLFRIYGNLDVVALEGGRFIHISYLNITGEDRTIIRHFVRRRIIDSDYGIVSSRALYPAFKIEYPDVCKRLGVANEQFGFFSLCNYLLENEFEFSRPFIGRRGTEDLTLNKILSRYVDDNRLSRFTFNDLDMYASRYNTFINRKIGFIEDTADKYLLVNDKEFINLEMIRIDNVQQIKDFLIFTVKRFKEIKISNFRIYFMIPKNEYIYWNKLTLFSFINAFCSDELEIKLLNNSYEYLDYVIRSVEK